MLQYMNMAVFQIGETDMWLRMRAIELICLKISKFFIRGLPPNSLLKRDQRYGQLKCRQQKIFYGKLRLKFLYPYAYAHSSSIFTFLTQRL